MHPHLCVIFGHVVGLVHIRQVLAACAADSHRQKIIQALGAETHVGLHWVVHKVPETPAGA
jgi:hypothetical protein